MTINKFNYEAFALDYLEGKLSVELTEEMERFLSTHPAIEAELSGMMEVVYLEPDTTIVYENKAALLKEEKVVWLTKKWIRPLMAAASVALLLMTYFVGYQAGVKQVDEVVVISDDSSSNNNESRVVANMEKQEEVDEKVLELPVVVEPELEKAVVKFVPKSTIPSTIIKESSEPFDKQELAEIRISEPADVVVENLPVVDTELMETIPQQKDNVTKGLTTLVSIGIVTPIFVPSITNKDSLKNLTNALTADVPVEKLATITIQKKKRSIKDFLGRFPVTQLKDALIPTYYKEETVGQ